MKILDAMVLLAVCMIFYNWRHGQLNATMTLGPDPDAQDWLGAWISHIYPLSEL